MGGREEKSGVDGEVFFSISRKDTDDWVCAGLDRSQFMVALLVES